MQVSYDGVHSILIGDFVNGKYEDSGFIDTWKDLHLIPTSVPVIQPPPLKTNTIEVPGSNGIVDMTEVLVGRPLYENRTGSIDFYIDNSSTEYCPDGEYRWDHAYDKLLNTLHGFRKKVILTDSRSFYYEGRVSVNSYKSDKLTGTITLDYDLDPFKMTVFTTTEPWKWNPFDFAYGKIPKNISHYFNYPVAEGESMEFEIGSDIAGIVPTIPTITAIPLTAGLDVDWEKTMESQPYPGISFYPDASASSNLIAVDFRETDKITDPDLGVCYRITNPTASNGYLLTIGDPKPGYKFKWRYKNYFRDSSRNIIPTQFLFDFRPRRL